MRRALVTIATALALGACSPAPTEVERSDPEVPEQTLVLTPSTGQVRTSVQGLGENDAPEDVLLVGDSVGALIADDVALRLSSTVYVDATDCRRIDREVYGPCGGVPTGVRVDSGVDAIEASMTELRSDAIQPEVAVIVLANNSSLTEEDLAAAMAELDGVERVWWVNTRIEGFGRQNPNNELLLDLARRDPRVGVVDWHGASEGEDWLADHVHPNEEGQRALARMVVGQIRCDCTP